MTTASMRMPPGMAPGDSASLRAPPPAIAQALKQLQTTPLLVAIGVLCVPLGVCVVAAMALLHSALVCSLLDLAVGWFLYLRWTLWDSIGTVHSRQKANHLLIAFHTPLLLAFITLRALVQRAISAHVPHTSEQKRRAVLAVSAAYIAAVYLFFGTVAAQAQADMATAAAAAAAAAAFPVGGAVPDPDAVTPASLFLSLYRITLLAALLSCASPYWVPTSGERLRAAEREMLRAHQASSGSGPRALDAQTRQLVAGHLAYTVLEGEMEQDEADRNGGKGVAEEKKGQTTTTPPADTVADAAAAALTVALGSASAASWDGTAVVFLHGYGVGKSFFFLNLPQLSAALPHARLYAVDLMGLGSSARGPSMARCASPADAEAYFVSALEGWRAAIGLRSIVLCGHGFGAYVAACYALRHPARVHQLVLASPLGLAVPPPIDPNTGMPAVQISVKAAAAMAAANGAPAPAADADGGPSPGASRWTVWAARAVRWLWSQQQLTLSDLLHFVGPLGPALFRLAVGRRFAQLDGARPRVRADGSSAPAGIHVAPLVSYLYHANAGACPGQRGLNLLLHPGGVHAYQPLLPRLKARLAVPCVLALGAEEWAEARHAEEIVAALQGRGDAKQVQAESPDATAAAAAAAASAVSGALSAASSSSSSSSSGAAASLAPVDAECVVLPQCGHQLYLENPRAFNALIVRVVCMAEARSKFSSNNSEVGADTKKGVETAGAAGAAVGADAAGADAAETTETTAVHPSAGAADAAGELESESELRQRAQRQAAAE